MTDQADNTPKTTEAEVPDPSTPVAQSPVKAKAWWRRYMPVTTLIAVGLLVYIAFFGEKSVTQRLEYQVMIDSLEQCLSQQRDSLEYYRQLNSRLDRDPELMEQVVREQYNMKREHEDVYVVERQ